MRAAYRGSEQSIQTLPLDKVPWLPSAHGKAAFFIPVGATFSSRRLAQEGFVPQHYLGGGPRQYRRLGVSSCPLRPAGDRSDCPCRPCGLLADGRAAPAGFGPRPAGAGRRARTLRQPSISDALWCARQQGGQHSFSLFRRISFRARRIFHPEEQRTCGYCLWFTNRGLRGVGDRLPAYRGGILFVRYGDLTSLANQVTRVLQDGNLRDSRLQLLLLSRFWIASPNGWISQLLSWRAVVGFAFQRDAKSDRVVQLNVYWGVAGKFRISDEQLASTRRG